MVQHTQHTHIPGDLDIAFCTLYADISPFNIQQVSLLTVLYEGVYVSLHTVLYFRYVWWYQQTLGEYTDQETVRDSSSSLKISIFLNLTNGAPVNSYPSYNRSDSLGGGASTENDEITSLFSLSLSVVLIGVDISWFPWQPVRVGGARRSTDSWINESGDDAWSSSSVFSFHLHCQDL